ncbi:Zinc-type alcohol dehydrogenase-like protein [Fulvia fulva]|uniref:Zinc-type alcohol dehydrogenase-like protein n=1 Tax=Passalora fulva TaxID=5499 RepID=A0A9Q8P659_PASFU|nr:Zinc-type alcohol dehydrogenase-like protein [Fulvia fulva]KAK4631549.1 Zinc-type alcohol dehydrogenase-like protein [Fulvia fulva]KAK4632942.1 Zinc-type alcohol dehydrogenase-like protein [Fulvia fulva]UJO14611.1 Zinc-type alcohol dehydrogenase-like protein [Fulvia fulva]WPV10449.1 Zinc-type alcohol dehydrogenase-like protein [Fulvia fulva]WPV25832.1 Zinc-type alcohol dehydrogenase-like protein [Fulvia fulva]
MPKALVIEKVEGKPGKVYYPLKTIEQPTPQPKDNDLVVKITHAALNHRDLFIRQGLYGAIGFGVPLLADGCGVVVQTGNKAKAWQGKRVILNPGHGWKDHPDGPESVKGYAILGGTKLNPLGTAAEVLCIDASEVEEAPSHLTSAEAAALPLAGLTAWRAVMTKSQAAKKGNNILVTGIGGGVAVMALLYAVAVGANVYVSSGSQEKIEKAKQLGAKGGVNYKEKDWDKKLAAALEKDTGRKKLDAIIDGAGGDIAQIGAKLLKDGGVIAQYGMTVGPKMTWIMPDVLKNIELRGSTMGSRKEFADLVKFVGEKGLKPLVSRTVQGIENIKDIDSLFEDMNKGTQLGKLVIEIAKDDGGGKSKL